MSDYTLIVTYALVALGASFLCSILEAVLLSTTHGHIRNLAESNKKVSEVWTQWKDDQERPLPALLTLNANANTVV